MAYVCQIVYTTVARRKTLAKNVICVLVTCCLSFITFAISLINDYHFSTVANHIYKHKSQLAKQNVTAVCEHILQRGMPAFQLKIPFGQVQSILATTCLCNDSHRMEALQEADSAIDSS